MAENVPGPHIRNSMNSTCLKCGCNLPALTLCMENMIPAPPIEGDTACIVCGRLFYLEVLQIHMKLCHPLLFYI